METLTIQLTKAQKAFAEAQAAEGGYRSVSKYLEDLLRAERRRKAEEELEKLIQEAEASGPPTPMTPEDWERIREKGMNQLAKEKENRAKNRKNSRSRK
jgi:antitoxin ParD1/3/4